MLEAFEAIENLAEVRRVFLVLQRGGRSRAEEAALIEACKHTAGLSTRYPRPKPAITIAVAAGLLKRSAGLVTITERGRSFVEKNQSGIDLSLYQARLLVGALLDQSVVEHALLHLLRNFQKIRGQLVARKNSLSSYANELLFCRLLQQVGAITVSGDYYVINRTFEDILADFIICASKLTQAELLQQLERQRERGERAEQRVLELERERLTALNRADLAAKVMRVSVTDVSAGYDISSYEKNNRSRFIEVKSSVGSDVAFEWSTGERATAKREGDAYFVYFVPLSFSLPDLLCPIVMIRNPASLIAQGILSESSSSYKVAAVSKAESASRRSEGISKGQLVSFRAATENQ